MGAVGGSGSPRRLLVRPTHFTVGNVRTCEGLRTSVMQLARRGEFQRPGRRTTMVSELVAQARPPMDTFKLCTKRVVTE